MDRGLHLEPAMKPLSKAAKKVFEKLVDGIEPGQAKKFDNANGAFMAAHVDRLTDNLFSIAHYYEQNGDLVSDPDMEFWRGPDGEIYPCSITHGALGLFVRGIEFADGKPSGVRPRTQRDQATFANTWLRNIKEQQGL